MSFYATEFVIDNISSLNYGITVSSIGDSGESSSSSGSDISLITQKLLRRPVPFLYGVEQTPVLQFPLSFNSVNGEINAVDAYNIEKWLFGHMRYRKLQIMQPDLEGIYYNCFFTEPETQRVGNKLVGYTCTIVCDSPFAWEYERTKTYTFSTPPNSFPITFFNTSDNNYYMFPKLEITMDNIGGTAQITNVSDSSRIFLLTALAGSEVITVNNDLQTLVSSTSLLRLSHFNKKWFRMIQGKNNLLVTGNIAQIKLIYQFARKVGG